MTTDSSSHWALCVSFLTIDGFYSTWGKCGILDASQAWQLLVPLSYFTMQNASCRHFTLCHTKTCSVTSSNTGTSEKEEWFLNHVFLKKNNLAWMQLWSNNGYNLVAFWSCFVSEQAVVFHPQIKMAATYYSPALVILLLHTNSPYVFFTVALMEVTTREWCAVVPMNHFKCSYCKVLGSSVGFRMLS